jgi:Phage tail lysozyme
MQRPQTYAKVVAWLLIMLSMSACSVFQFAAPPPLETAFVPAPPPPRPLVLLPPSPQEAQAEIARWFSAKGYHEYQVAALVQHARTESGFRACAVGPADLRYTFQWGGTRLRQLHEFAHTDGCPQLDTQLAFADKELRNEPKYGCFWGATTEPAAYAALRRGFGAGSC